MAFPGCNSTELLALIPCFECLSETQLLAIKARIMCQINGRGADCDPATMRDEASCLVCFSDRHLMILEIALLYALAVERGDREAVTPEELADEVKCLVCLPPHDLKAIFEKQLCDWFTALVLPQ